MSAENKKQNATGSRTNGTGMHSVWQRLITIIALLTIVFLAGILIHGLKPTLRDFVFVDIISTVLFVSVVAVFLYLIYLWFIDSSEDPSKDRTGRYLFSFWFIVWALFTAFWLTIGPDSKEGFRFGDYLLIVAVPAFFPVSAIAYTQFQNQRKVEDLQEQFKLLGLAKVEGLKYITYEHDSVDRSLDQRVVRKDDIARRYEKTHSAASFSIQTVLPVLLSVVGIYLIIIPAQLLLNTDEISTRLEESIENIQESVPSSSLFLTGSSDVVILLNDFREIRDNVADLDETITRNFAALSIDYSVLLALRYGFLGAYVFCVQLIYRRYTTLDLKPSIYMQCTATLLAGFAFNYVAFEAIGHITGQNENITGISAAFTGIVAFSLGYFPGFAIRWFNHIAYKALGSSSDRTDTLPLTYIEGLSDFHEVRLRDEGIDNVQNLASASIEDLIINTPFNTLQIVDWIDQAVLRLYVTQDEADAFRRGGIRGISDFRNLWSIWTVSGNGENRNGQQNGAQPDNIPALLTKESLAARLQSTEERLDILYRTTDAAPNLAFLDYPQKHNVVVASRSESAKSAETSDVENTRLFERLLKHVEALPSYEKIDESLVSVFEESKGAGPRLSPDVETKYALPLARWYRRLSELVQSDDLKTKYDEAACKHYVNAKNNQQGLEEEEISWLTNNYSEPDVDTT